MTIDIERCENCNNCFLACKDEHFENDWLPYALAQPRHGHHWMNILKKEHGQFPHIGVAYMARPCFHCPDPPCKKGLFNGEIYKREDGIVLVDPEKSKGRKELVSACPHGAIWWNDENQTPQKCTFCAHLLDGEWEQPRCVQACPTGALRFLGVEADEFETLVDSQGLETAQGNRPRSAETSPLVLYKNLDRFNKAFIAGSVAAESGGITECVAGAEVVLIQKGKAMGQQETDAFGDFRFTGLVPDSGRYELELRMDGSLKSRVQAELGSSSSLGTIWI